METVTLQYPFEWADDKGQKSLIEKINLNRPKGKHIKNIGKDAGMKDIMAIASKVSGFTPAFFDEMDASDLMRVAEVVGDFLDSGPKTGKTS